MYLIDSPWFCWVSERFRMDLVEAKEEGRGGGEEGEEGEGEGGQQNWSCGKKFPLLPCLVQVCYCYSGACKGGTLCGPVFLLF